MIKKILEKFWSSKKNFKKHGIEKYNQTLLTITKLPLTVVNPQKSYRHLKGKCNVKHKRATDERRDNIGVNDSKIMCHNHKLVYRHWLKRHNFKFC